MIRAVMYGFFFAFVHSAQWTAYFDQRRYLFVEEISSWAAARAGCKALDAELVSISTDESWTFIRKVLNKTAGYPYYVSANDQVSEGLYEWFDGVQFDASHYAWFPGFLDHDAFNKQPNDNSHVQNCIDIKHSLLLNGEWTESDSYYMNDCSCSAERYYICQQDACGFGYQMGGRCGEHVQEKKLKQKHGYIQTLSTYDSFTVMHKMLCASNCLKSRRCMSANYNLATKLCLLNEEATGTVVSDSDYKFYVKL